jgi:hypothetical protein
VTGEHAQDAGHGDPPHVDDRQVDHEHGGHEHLSHVPDGARPAVFAARASLVFEPPAHADLLEDAVIRFLALLSEGLTAAGCTLVGHIKGIVSAGGHGDLAFHATTLRSTPAITGGVAGMLTEATLTVNVIVFGVDEQALPAVVRDAWSRAAGAETTWPS